MFKTFAIFSTSELYKINFDEVLETSIETVRKSIDSTKTFVKWYGNAPNSVLQLTTIEGFYTLEQILEIVKTSEWNKI